MRVGDVLLDVDEVPDGGLLFVSSFCCSDITISVKKVFPYT